MDKFNGTGTYSGRAFQTLFWFSNIAAVFKNGADNTGTWPTGGYATLSRFEDNGPSISFLTVPAGVDARARQLFADLLAA